MRLAGKRAIVTGGAGGIGRATAAAFAAEGAAVAVLDLDEAGARAVAEAITSSGGTAIALGVDVSDEQAVAAAVEAVVAEFGGLDVVFNNAGIARRTTAVETALADWELSFAVNVRSIFLMCKHAIRTWRRPAAVRSSTPARAGGSRAAPGRCPTVPPRVPW